MYRYVIFDLDGTLLNTLDDLAAACNEALRQSGFPTHPTPRYRYFVGNGMDMLMRRIVPSGTDGATLAAVRARFDAYYDVHKSDFTRPYAGMPALLKSLHAAGVKSAVVTNKDHVFAETLVRSWYGDTVEAVFGMRPNVEKKPDPALVFEAMRRLDADPAQTLYAGDSDVDVFTAHNAGLPACGVLWGFRPAEELTAAGVDLLAASPAQLGEIVLGQPPAHENP